MARQKTGSWHSLNLICS